MASHLNCAYIDIHSIYGLATDVKGNFQPLRKEAASSIMIVDFFKNPAFVLYSPKKMINW